MNVMKAIDSEPDVPKLNYDDFAIANRALENLKCWLANITYFEEALRISEMLRDLDRTRQQVDHRGDPIL
jgi:hypothetical protein